MKISLLNKYPIWVYEDVDKMYSDRTGFRELVVREQGAFNKQRAKHVRCYHLIQSSDNQVVGRINAHIVS
jgi:hypothetical protein